MKNTQLIEAALEEWAGGSCQAFFDLLSEDVTWEWFEVEELPNPVIGKASLTEGFMHGAVGDVPPGSTFWISHVYDRDDDDEVIVAEVGRHARAAGGHQCRSAYYTWAFDLVDHRVMHVWGYLEPDD